MARNSLASRLRSVLRSSREEDTQRFLAQHSGILIHAFCPTGTYFCIPKFPFGREYVPDFLLVQLLSTITRILMIELEPPPSRPFTKSGTYARRLNGAHLQIMNWLAWITENGDYFAQSVLRKIREMDPQAARMIEHRIRYHSVKAKIVIGRRSMMTAQDNTRRAALYLGAGESIEIVPYDRLIEVASRMNTIENPA